MTPSVGHERFGWLIRRKSKNKAAIRKTSLIASLAGICITSGASCCFPEHATAQEPRNLLVGIVDNYLPCSDETSEGYEGLSIDIWRRVAEKLQQPYTLVSIPSFSAAVDSAAFGSVDIIASCHKITAERVERVDFSIPYTRDSLGILSREDISIDLTFIKKLFSKKSFIFFLASLLTISGVAALLIGRLENGFSDLSGFAESRRAHLTKAWIMLLIGSGVDKLMHKNRRAHLVILIATLYRILVISILVGTTASLLFEPKTPADASKLNRAKLKLFLSQGLVVNSGTKMHEWILQKIEEHDLLSEAEKGLIPVLEEGMAEQMLNSGQASHALSDISVLRDIWKDLDRPNDFRISLEMKNKTPQGFIFGSELDNKSRKKINIELAKLNHNGDSARLGFAWEKQ